MLANYYPLFNDVFKIQLLGKHLDLLYKRDKLSSYLNKAFIQNILCIKCTKHVQTSPPQSTTPQSTSPHSTIPHSTIPHSSSHHSTSPIHLTSSSHHSTSPIHLTLAHITPPHPSTSPHSSSHHSTSPIHLTSL